MQQLGISPHFAIFIHRVQSNTSRYSTRNFTQHAPNFPFNFHNSPNSRINFPRLWADDEFPSNLSRGKRRGQRHCCFRSPKTRGALSRSTRDPAKLSNKSRRITRANQAARCWITSSTGWHIEYTDKYVRIQRWKEGERKKKKKEKEKGRGMAKLGTNVPRTCKCKKPITRRTVVAFSNVESPCKFDFARRGCVPFLAFKHRRERSRKFSPSLAQLLSVSVRAWYLTAYR